MNILNKIQKLPERTRKLILWSIIIIVGLILFTFWINGFNKRFKSFEGEKFMEGLNLPSFNEELEGIPGLEISKEEIKEKIEELEEAMKETDEYSPVD